MNGERGLSEDESKDAEEKGYDHSDQADAPDIGEDVAVSPRRYGSYGGDDLGSRLRSLLRGLGGRARFRGFGGLKDKGPLYPRRRPRGEGWDWGQRLRKARSAVGTDSACPSFSWCLQIVWRRTALTFSPCLVLIKNLWSDYSRQETGAANAERHALGWALSYWSRTWSLARWV